MGNTKINQAEAHLRKRIGLRQFACVEGQVLYRSRHLDELDNSDVEALLTLGILDVYDLRKTVEREECGHLPRVATSPFRLHVLSGDLQGDPLHAQTNLASDVAEAYGTPGERMKSLYSVMAHHDELLHEVIDPLLHSTTPALVHCAFGKDRTGVVCACIQRTLGKSHQHIMEDYLATNQLNAPLNKRDLAALSPRLSAEELAIMASMFEAREPYLEAFWKTLEMRHGSFEAFMKAR